MLTHTQPARGHRSSPLAQAHGRFRRVTLACTGLLWVLAVSFGVRSMWAYENAPGTAGAPPSRLAPALARNGEARLFLAAHPRCPCTRATLEELAQIVAAHPGRMRATVLFFKPSGTPDTWAHSDTWRQAAAIAGVEVSADEAGRTARSLGAATSGDVAFYGADGRLQFSGGITDARGHSSDSAGRRAILALLAGKSPTQTETPVYGCSLIDPVALQGPEEAGAWRRSR